MFTAIKESLKSEFGKPESKSRSNSPAHGDYPSTTIHPDTAKLQQQLQQARDQLKSAREEAVNLRAERHSILEKYTGAHRTIKNLQLENDNLRQRQGKVDTQSADLKLAVQDLRDALKRSQDDIELLHADTKALPLSDMDLLASHTRVREVFDSMRETLSCPLCYDPFGPGDVVTLKCGHSSCLKCLNSWIQSSLLSSMRQGKPTTWVECPECRQSFDNHGVVKMFMLEEVVRVVNRLLKADKKAEDEKIERLRKEHQHTISLASEAMETSHETVPDISTDEIAATTSATMSAPQPTRRAFVEDVDEEMSEAN